MHQKETCNARCEKCRVILLDLANQDYLASCQAVDNSGIRLAVLPAGTDGKPDVSLLRRYIECVNPRKKQILHKNSV